MRIHTLQTPTMTTKVLTIDDQGDIRRLIRMALEFQGHEVSEALNAETGLQMARREKPDVILLDVNMPGMNGVDFCQVLADDPALSSIPVIMLSGVEDEATRQRALAAGAKVYLTKPFNPMYLLELVEQYAT